MKILKERTLNTAITLIVTFVTFTYDRVRDNFSKPKNLTLIHGKVEHDSLHGERISFLRTIVTLNDRSFRI